MLNKLFAKPPPRLPAVRLFYRDGSSDKEYSAAITHAVGGFMVTFAFGRRGTALTTGTKTTSPVPLEKAQQIYDKLIADKQAKGYTPHGSGALFALTENANRTSGLHPQLLNSIDEEAARRHLADDAWCLQEKFDGKRIMVVVKSGTVEGSNRKGLYVSLPQEVVDSLLHLPDSVLGRPASGGSQMKCKFYATCTCLVSAQNDQRSVRLSLLDAAGNAVCVGNVTIPSSKAVPQIGTLVEVRYLYAYKGGSLYQAAYLGERDDIEQNACVLEQLKYKPKGYAAETDT